MGIWEIICLMLYVTTGDGKESFICWIGGYMVVGIAAICLIYCH